jgi:hypothetical protein
MVAPMTGQNRYRNAYKDTHLPSMPHILDNEAEKKVVVGSTTFVLPTTTFEPQKGMFHA